MFDFNYAADAVSVGMNLAAWVLIGLAAFRIYKRQQVKPKVWKIAVVIVAGLISFSINWELKGTLVKIPILPLGVWGLYGILKRKEDRWDHYRSFAWLGFAGNFVFLAAALISIPFYAMVYPPHDASTHIADAGDASIAHTHPSGEEGVVLDKGRLVDQLTSMKQEKVVSDVWYEEMYHQSDGYRNKNERFPYQLLGTSPKWGSGMYPVIYVERDGRGILITTSRDQLYFRSNDSILMKEEVTR
ncbi:hypothetical protein [Bacillus sp. Marseille-Q1617]|uniref:hypothetical protein n=1 Tax=Bacillus sp. Marseille-Q1617 TaxID=2736887 RepID=UPI00158ECAFF|nr:hypothetical protein [Bacillus sp. Marseille-Q1617]